MFCFFYGICVLVYVFILLLYNGPSFYVFIMYYVVCHPTC